jgi:hypothetical protein
MRRRPFNLDRFFRRHPAFYLLIRLLIFGGGGSLAIWKCIEWGIIPGRRGGSIHYAEHPAFFVVLLTLCVSGVIVVVATSILVYLKQSGRLPRGWKPYGLDFRR